MKAVITAGGRIDGAFAQVAGTQVKALANLRGMTMLERVVESLRACGVTRIAIVGGAEVRASFASRVEAIVDESPSGSQNLLRALRAWPEDGEALLYATSDLPYVTAAAVGDFVDRLDPGAIAVSLSEFAAYASRFPGSPAAGITLGGERVVNGGIFSIPAGASAPIANTASRFFEARKQPWRMAGLVSPPALLRFLFGRLRIADLEAEATRVLAYPARAVRNCAPELAFDVDGIAEYEYVCAQA
ncbi:MAG TPA: NTP transferase domain-containing protein [Candidatus Cybelea sp.]